MLKQERRTSQLFYMQYNLSDNQAAFIFSSLFSCSVGHSKLAWLCSEFFAKINAYKIAKLL